MKSLAVIGFIVSLIMIGNGLYNHESHLWISGWYGSAIWSASTFLALCKKL